MITKEEYNEEPVHYCAMCLSLNVKTLTDIGLDICGECGNTDIKETKIDEWNKMYYSEYDKMFLEDDFVDEE